MGLITGHAVNQQNISGYGPPTQATGPTWSGAGVGVGMLMGAGDPLLDFFLDLEIYQDSTIVRFRSVGKNLGEAYCF